MKNQLLIIISLIGIGFSICISCQVEKTQTTHFTPIQKLEELYKNDLKQSITHLEEISNVLNLITQDSIYDKLHLQKTRQHYIQARTYFKKAEPILSFVDAENYKFLIQPNFLKVEEESPTEIRPKEAIGFQVLEELLFLDSANNEKNHIQTIKQNIELTSKRLILIERNTNLSSFENYHVLWIVRDALVRVALTGITGFDSPSGRSLQDSQEVYQQLQTILTLFEDNFVNKNLFNAWQETIRVSLTKLTSDFDTFDRYDFIKNQTHIQLQLWTTTAKDWKVTFPFELALQNNASSLFSDSTFNLEFFYDYQLGKINQERIVLGKQLFNDVNLSTSKKMSCATCHQTHLAFTDGEKISKGQKRNSPTLTYAALQKGFFYENRVGSLEGQIVAVVNNENEFHSNAELLQKEINNNPKYKAQFEKLYEKGVTDMAIRNAIASYIRSLSPFSSKFDKNINNVENTLTSNEINGFNLFMGKAACATCHFAPLFNGTVPPNFRESEMELIGVPAQNDTIHVSIDEDLGRFNLYQTESRKYFFKTPTLRNISKTAPYMHNGVYQNLEEVIDFYNRGGGAGIGIELEHQTLPTEPLNLSTQEQSDLIAFLKTLEDL